jgi:hypothetical protein
MAARKDGRGHTGASQQVMTYLRQHANTVIPYPELKEAIGAKDKFTVPNAITHLVAKGMPIERPMRGFAVYRTMPKVGFASEADPVPEPVQEPEKPTQKLWEFVGNSKGVTIVKGEDDELYVVTPLIEWITQP